MTDEQIFNEAIQLGRADRDELLAQACESSGQRARVEAAIATTKLHSWSWLN
jgi:hypothetical protein